MQDPVVEAMALEAEAEALHAVEDLRELDGLVGTVVGDRVHPQDHGSGPYPQGRSLFVSGVNRFDDALRADELDAVDGVKRPVEGAAIQLTLFDPGEACRVQVRRQQRYWACLQAGEALDQHELAGPPPEGGSLRPPRHEAFI